MRRLGCMTAIFGAFICLILSSGVNGAQAETSSAKSLGDVLRLSELSALLHEDGLAHGATLDQDMLNGEGGVSWRLQVAGIYAQSRIEQQISATLSQDLSPEHQVQITAFFAAPLGQEILTLELDARRLMADEAFELRVINDLKDRRHEGAPLFEAVARFMSVNALVDYNVSGALNANFQFLRSFAREGGGQAPESEPDRKVVERYHRVMIL